MVFNTQIIEKLKEKSGLAFDKSKDFELLGEDIYRITGRTIGITTLKRLIGYISDERNTNEYTLNTIGIYLGYASWSELCSSLRIDSDWNFLDDKIYIDELPLGKVITVKYLNRTLSLEVSLFMGRNALRVIEATNSSLKSGDILMVDYLQKGKILEARTVYRGDDKGKYRTNGELKDIILE